MKKFIIFIVISAVGALITACQPSGGALASGDDEAYQPRRAPLVQVDNRNINEIRGELIGVDLARKTMTVRVESGMVQTFHFTNFTTVVGLDNVSTIRSLAGKEGSEVRVRWKDRGEAKFATTIEVTDVSVTNYSYNHRRH